MYVGGEMVRWLRWAQQGTEGLDVTGAMRYFAGLSALVREQHVHREEGLVQTGLELAVAALRQSVVA